MSFVYQQARQVMPVPDVQNYIKEGFSHAKCQHIHPLPCNQFCLNYVFTTWGNTYRTYAFVYIIQLIFRFKKMRQNLPKQLPKLIFAYIKSTSLTAVQMMLMRRILCFLCKHYSNKQNNLIAANFLSAFYLLIESTTRRKQISLYQLNNTSLIIFNMLKRRGFIGRIPKGQCLLFGLAMMVLCFSYYDCKQAFQRSYILTIFEHLTGENQ